jgi:hypothetical protein
MRSAVLAVLAMMTLPFVCEGQSVLTFPRIMQAQDFKTTGFALVNPTAANASVTYTLYGEDGNPVGTASQTIPAQGQLSRLASEFFPGATTAGWIQATSSTAGLQGFWFSGDFSTFADGAEAAASATELVLPLISPQSEIHVVNTGTTDVTLLLKLLGTEKSDLVEPFPQRIPAKGFFKANMASVFSLRGLDDLSLPSHMRISCGCADPSPLAATVIARDFLAAPSSAVSNGTPAATAATTIYFPYIVEGPQGSSNWRSLLGLTNLSTSSYNDVAITFVSDSGIARPPIQQTLPPNGGFRFTARDLFGLTGFQTGWIRVTSTSGLPLTGYIAYADLVAAGVAVVPPQQDAQANLLFAHIADLPPWLTGIALLNTNTAAANVEVFALNPNGSLIGSTSFSLQPGSNTAKLLRELIPQTQTRTSDGGFVFVRSSLPIFGIELFFSRNLQVLANVSAGKLAPGITFVPPSR